MTSAFGKTLDGKTLVLVTRAGEPGRQLTRRIHDAGLSAMACPPIALVGPEDPQKAREDLDRLLPADRVVVTSGEALRQAVSLVGAERFGDRPVIVPGPGTAARARTLGLECVVHPPHGGDSEAMLALEELTSVRDLRVLILAAAGGRELLQRELARRGARVDRLHVYRRLPVPLPAELDARVAEAGATITLAASLGALEALQMRLDCAAGAKLRSGVVIVPSVRAADGARAMGWTRVVQAGGADDAAMLEALGNL